MYFFFSGNVRENLTLNCELNSVSQPKLSSRLSSRDTIKVKFGSRISTAQILSSEL